MIRAALFDCDGLVIQRQEGDYFSQRWARDFNIPNGQEKILPFFKNEFLLCEAGKADLKVELGKRIKDWGYPGTVEELLQYWFEGESTKDPEIIATITEMRGRGVKCFLSTNNEKYRTRYLWETVGLRRYLDGMFSSATLGFLKPDVKFWGGIHERLPQMAKEEILAWDNKKECVQSASDFGFMAELFEDLEQYKQIMREKYQLL